MSETGQAALSPAHASRTMPASVLRQAGVAVGALALTCGIYLSYAALSGAGAAAPAGRPAPQEHGFGPRSLLSLPAAAQAPVSAGLGADNSAYRVESAPSGLRAANPAQRDTSSFERSGVSVSAAGRSLGLRVRGIGYGGSLRPLAPVAPRVSASNRVVYVRPGLSEWYANGPLGLEQGFTVARPAAGRVSGPLTLAMSLTGGLRAALAPGGHSVTFTQSATPVLRYGDLVATDARGRALPTWLSLRGSTLLLHVRTAGASFPLRIDPLVSVAKEKVKEAVCALALSGNGETALVGQCERFGEGPGEVLVYSDTGGHWGLQATLTATGEAGKASFGASVAISANGDTALIGAPGPYREQEGGAAFVFTRSPEGAWSQQVEMTEAGAQRFGDHLALAGDGETAVIDAGLYTGKTKEQSSLADVYQREGEAWTLQTQLEPELGVEDVAISGDGDTALLGNPEYGHGKVKKEKAVEGGAVWVYTRSEGAWSEQARLTRPAKKTEAFGLTLALSEEGNTALISSYSRTRQDVWAFQRTGETWTEQTGIAGPKGDIEFGTSFALSSDGDLGLIGAPDYSEGRVEPQFVYVYAHEGVTWKEREAISGHIKYEEEFFGENVALSGDGETALMYSIEYLPSGKPPDEFRYYVKLYQYEP